jgi:hypothetical protein
VDITEDTLRSSAGAPGVAANVYDDVGFRVVSLTAVPEPSTYAALFGLAA